MRLFALAVIAATVPLCAQNPGGGGGGGGNSGVQSVNGQTGVVTLTIPTTTSQLTNNSGFINASGAPVQSVNSQTGAVSLAIPTTTSQLTNDSGYLSATYPLLFPATQASGYLFTDGAGNITFATGTGASPPAINYTPSGTSPNTLTQQVANMKVIQFCQDWGKCDGTTEDTSAWNNMANQLSGNAVKILVPSGKTLLVHSPQVKSNMIVECGKGATFKDSGSANFAMLNVTFQHDWTVTGCTFDQGGIQLTNSNNAVVYLQGDTNFTFSNNRITNSGAPSPNTAGILVFQDNGGKIDNNMIDETITGTQIDIDNGVASQQSVQASTIIGSNALDNLLWIQAATPGTAGNSQTVTIANDGASQSLSFSGTATALTIHLATDASSNSTSTAASIISGFRGNALEKNFRIITHDTATGIVAANAVTTLAGGLDSNNPIIVSNNRLNGSMSNGIHIEAAGGSAGTYCNVDVYGNLITNVWDWSDYQATSSAHSGENGNGIDIDSCSGVHVHDNTIMHTDFSGIRIFNGWYNDIGPNNLIRFAGEQSLYAEFNSQGNIFHDNKVYDGLFGVNDNNAELRTNKQLNEYVHNSFRDIAGTGIVCNACIEKDNTFEGVIIGTQITGGGSGGYNSQLVDNTCIVSQDPTLPPTLNCIGLGSGYGGTSTLIEGNRTIGTPTFGHIWGVGNPSGHITNIALGNPTTVTFSTGTPATGNTACFFGIALFSTHELNGHCYTATVSGSSFTVPVDSTGFSPWVATTSAANTGSANGWRFPGFWYDGDTSTSPAAFNSHMLVRGEDFKDAVKGTPSNGSFGFIQDDDCSVSGTLTNLGAGAGTWAFYNASWSCHPLGAAAANNATYSVADAVYPTDIGYYNVKDYGAVGNGTTDDTASIRAAMTAALTGASQPNSGNGKRGSTVYFPAGTYLVSDSLMWTEPPTTPAVLVAHLTGDCVSSVSVTSGGAGYLPVSSPAANSAGLFFTNGGGSGIIKPFATVSGGVITGVNLAGDTCVGQGFTSAPTVQAVNWRGWLRFEGQNKSNTIIKLKDNAAGFTNGNCSVSTSEGLPRENCKAVIYTANEGTASSNGWGETAYEDDVWNLTVDTGTGNNGAVAISWVGSNRASVRNVNILSDDLAGRCGLDVSRNGNNAGGGPAYIKNVSVTGFDYGINANSASHEVGYTFEYVNLERQKVAGVLNNNFPNWFREISSTNTVPVFVNEGSGSLLIVDGTFLGGSSSVSAIQNQATGSNGIMFARNITTDGYASALATGPGNTIVPGSGLTEYSFPAGVSAFNATPKSIDLPDIPNTPEFVDNNFADWASVETFGVACEPNSGSDATACIQSAFNSGKPVVYFPYGNYITEATLTVPTSVRKIVGANSIIRGPGSTRQSFAPFQINSNGSSVEFSNLTFNLTTIGFPTFKDNGSSDLIIEDVFDADGYQNTALGTGKLYLENAAVPGASTFTNQTVYARQWDVESGTALHGTISGGTVWVFGYKSEGAGELWAVNNATFELLGQFSSGAGGPSANPAFVTTDSSFSIEGLAIAESWPTLISEKRSTTTRTTPQNTSWIGTRSAVGLYDGTLP